MSNNQIQIREICSTCEGTKTRSDVSEEQARSRARSHNADASEMAMGGNYLSWEHFIKCNDCSDGFKYTWCDISFRGPTMSICVE